MGWSQVLKHPFISQHFKEHHLQQVMMQRKMSVLLLYVVRRCHSVKASSLGYSSPLTNPMTESQELAKEMQRQNKAAK